jgi:hypothetical protein
MEFSVDYMKYEIEEALIMNCLSETLYVQPGVIERWDRKGWLPI